MLSTFLHWSPSRPFLYTVNVPTPVELHVVQDKVPAPLQVPPTSSTSFEMLILSLLELSSTSQLFPQRLLLFPQGEI